MPDSTGKFYLEDFRAELRARGFEGMNSSQLDVFINRAYFAVARKARWSWEKTTDSFTIAAGAFYADLATELPNFRSLDKVYVTTTGYQKKLTIMDGTVFEQQWFPLDLSSVQYRAEPTHYYLFENKLYILAPPTASRDFVAHYRQRPTWMTTDKAQPITPLHLDEAIIDAARVRAHTRVNENAQAGLARQDLEEFFDDMRDDEEEDMAEEPTRVTPDRTWL